MPKKKHKAAQVRLDPDNEKMLRDISERNPLKPSVAQLVNSLIRTHGWALLPPNEQR